MDKWTLRKLDHCVVAAFLIISTVLYYGGYFFPTLIGPFIGIGTVFYLAVIVYLAVRYVVNLCSLLTLRRSRYSRARSDDEGTSNIHE